MPWIVTSMTYKQSSEYSQHIYPGVSMHSHYNLLALLYHVDSEATAEHQKLAFENLGFDAVVYQEGDLNDASAMLQVFAIQAIANDPVLAAQQTREQTEPTELKEDVFEEKEFILVCRGCELREVDDYVRSVERGTAYGRNSFYVENGQITSEYNELLSERTDDLDWETIGFECINCGQSGESIDDVIKVIRA